MESNNYITKTTQENKSQQSEDKVQLTNYFSYGSNNLQQMRDRLKNQELMAFKAYSPNHFRVFAGWSYGWDGATASLSLLKEQTEIYKPAMGLIYQLNLQQIQVLDRFEGCSSQDPYNKEDNIYYRQNIQAVMFDKDGKKIEIEALAYIKSDKSWKGKPSDDYLEAIEKTIGTEQEIKIIRNDNLQLVK